MIILWRLPLLAFLHYFSAAGTTPSADSCKNGRQAIHHVHSSTCCCRCLARTARHVSCCCQAALPRACLAAMHSRTSCPARPHRPTSRGFPNHKPASSWPVGRIAAAQLHCAASCLPGLHGVFWCSLPPGPPSLYPRAQTSATSRERWPAGDALWRAGLRGSREEETAVASVSCRRSPCAAQCPACRAAGSSPARGARASSARHAGSPTCDAS
jgi:hypothetical protein